MSSFVSKRPVRVSVDEKPGEWIDIKPKLSVGDRAAFQNLVLKAEFKRGDKDKDADDNQANISMAPGDILYRMLELSVVGWELHDDEGNSVPFKRELIRELDQDDPLVDKVFQEVTERNPTLMGSSATTG